MKPKIFFITLVMLLSVTLSQADDVTINITATVDKEEIRIGDRVKLDIIVENVSGLELSFLEKPENLADFSFIGSNPIKKGWGKIVVGREYILGIYTTGTHVIPPVAVRFREDDSDGPWFIAESPQVPIEVQSVLTGEETDIMDLKGLIASGSGTIYLLFIIAAVIYFVVVLWIAWKKRQTRLAEPVPVVIRPADEIAYEQLNALLNDHLPEKGQVKEYYIRLSDIARHYLENRFTYRAPEMTTEEFLDHIKVSPELIDIHKDLLKEFLYHCDMVKFAKYGPTKIEMLDSFKAAERLVDQTREREDPVEKVVEK